MRRHLRVSRAGLLMAFAYVMIGMVMSVICVFFLITMPEQMRAAQGGI